MIGTNRNGRMAVFNVENAGITKKRQNKKVHIQMIKNKTKSGRTFIKKYQLCTN